MHLHVRRKALFEKRRITHRFCLAQEKQILHRPAALTPHQRIPAL